MRMAPLYATMIGTPVLMLLALLSYLWYPAAARLVLIPLITMGLLVFGLLGAREVYSGKRTPKGSPIALGVSFSAGRHAVAQAGKPAAKDIALKVKRFNPQTRSMSMHEYRMPANRFMTVLEALIAVKEGSDNTLSVRYSCRMGICGSCGMVINGKPALACETNVLKNLNCGAIEVEPMQGHPLLKDLVDDFDDFFAKHGTVNPHLYRVNKREQYEARTEYRQSQEDIEEFLPYSYCIMCGLCMDACPVVNTNPDFIGPQPLSQAYRYHADSRDQRGQARIEDVDVLRGLWSCEFAGACSKVCPKGVDPATAIQLMKGEAMRNNIINEKSE